MASRNPTDHSYRDSDTDLQNYWDSNNIPAPHSLSGAGSPYPPINPRHSAAGSDPFRSTPSIIPNSNRGSYLAPEAAVAAAEMHSYAERDRYAELNEAAPSTWLEKEQGGTRKSKVWLWGGIVVAGILIIAGIVAGVVISQGKKGSSSSSGGGGSKGGGVVSNPNDPSDFTKNDKLHNSFYGFAYTPIGAILPDCGAKLEDVITDIQLISQLTTRIRTYGADCNVSALVLEAIKQTKVNMTVYLGIYINDNDTVYERQRDTTKQALIDYGVDHVAGLTVGNEFILNNMTAASATDPTGPVGVAAATFLSAKVADVRSMIAGMSLPKTLTIGTADAGSYFNTAILANVDYAMANIHPWFGSVSIDQAAGWTADFFQTQDVDLGKTVSNNPQMYIAETGWPTNSSTAAAMTNGGGAAASVANLQTFLDNFVCQANQNNTGYFFFEFMDEPWKTVQYGGVEGYWGLFDEKKNLKDVTIPTCDHS